MEIVKIGKSLEDLTVKQVVDILKFAKRNENLPPEYSRLLSENVNISSDLLSLRLVDAYIGTKPRLLELGSKVLAYYESRVEPQAPVEFARRMAEISGGIKPEQRVTCEES